jgi:NUMOD4 motif-containing protein/HNH endonuclease
VTEWRAIPGWEGLYEVSNDGRVRSLARTARYPRWGNPDHVRLVRARELKLFESYGVPSYRLVRLYRNGLSRQYKVHILVAEVFLSEGKSAGPNVLHWDDDQDNNHVSNLRWGTLSDNQQDRIRNRRRG